MQNQNTSHPGITFKPLVIDSRNDDFFRLKRKNEIFNLILGLKIEIVEDPVALFQKVLEHQKPYSIGGFDETKLLEEEKLISASKYRIEEEVKNFLFYFIGAVDEKREDAAMRRYFSKISNVKVKLNKVVISIIKGSNIKEYYLPLNMLINKEYENYSFDQLIRTFKECS